MSLHEVIPVFDWFKIVFIENNGMAYGMEIGSKIALSLFRIVAICWLTWYIIRQVRQDAKTGYIVCMVMVLAGAAGNLIDCMFYGLIFNGASESYVSYFVFRSSSPIIPRGYPYGVVRSSSSSVLYSILPMHPSVWEWPCSCCSIARNSVKSPCDRNPKRL